MEKGDKIVADAGEVTLEYAIKHIFCCMSDVVLEDVTVAGQPAKRSVPAGQVKIAWYFLSYGGKTITFTLYDPTTYETLDWVIDAIRLDATE